jgi:hypothetical protein
VTSRSNFKMSADVIAAMVEDLLARRDKGESPRGVLGVKNVFELSALRLGLERHGIRIAAILGESHRWVKLSAVRFPRPLRSSERSPC